MKIHPFRLFTFPKMETKKNKIFRTEWERVKEIGVKTENSKVGHIHSKILLKIKIVNFIQLGSYFVPLPFYHCQPESLEFIKNSCWKILEILGKFQVRYSLIIKNWVFVLRNFIYIIQSFTQKPSTQ